jgi:hypothetical protein
MGSIHAVLVLANEEAAATSSTVSPIIFGLFTFGALALALVAIMMINVDR